MRKYAVIVLLTVTAIAGAQAQIVKSESHITTRHVIDTQDAKTHPGSWRNLLYGVNFGVNNGNSHEMFGFDLTYTKANAFNQDSPLFYEYGIGFQYLGGGYDKGSGSVSYSFGLVRIPLNIIYDYQLASDVYADFYAGLNIGGNLFGSVKYSRSSKNDESQHLFRPQVGFNCGVKMRLYRFVVGIGYNKDFTDLGEIPETLVGGLSYMSGSIGLTF